MREFNYAELTNIAHEPITEAGDSHMMEDERFYELLKDIKAAVSPEKDDFSSLFIYL